MKISSVILFVTLGFSYSVNAQSHCKWDKTNMVSGFDKPFSIQKIESDGTKFIHSVDDYQLEAKTYIDSKLSPELKVYFQGSLIGISSGKYLGVRAVDDTEIFFTITCN